MSVLCNADSENYIKELLEFRDKCINSLYEYSKVPNQLNITEHKSSSLLALEILFNNKFN